jgi:hypothetical protein
MVLRIGLAVFACLASLAGCEGRRAVTEGTDTDTGSEVDNTGCQLVDILFVIDDSWSMQCEQLMLAEGFPEFIEVLEQYNNDNADQIAYRVGVTTSGRDISCWEETDAGVETDQDDGVNGELMTTGGERWIDGPGDIGELSDAFADLADVGVWGADPEMPLDSLRMAIEKTAPGLVNEGFLRDHSLFVAVIITDEDDYSLTVDTFECDEFPWDLRVPLVEYSDFLDEWFGGPERYVVVVIAGAWTCTETTWASVCEEGDMYLGAYHAERLEEFVKLYVGDGYDEYGHFADICTTDLPTGLAQGLSKLTIACDEYVIE